MDVKEDRSRFPIPVAPKIYPQITPSKVVGETHSKWVLVAVVSL